MKGISLFSCAGIGEFFLNQLNIDFVVANDIDPVRFKTYNYFHQNTKTIVGDVTKQETKKQILDSVKNENIEFLLATPPCQGMSSVGKNRKDNSLQFDIRNSLVLESIDIIEKTNPTYILFENVPRFLKVKCLYLNEYLTIVEILEKRFGNDYNIKVNVFNSADFEIPQTRNRVFIRLFKKGTSWKDPELNKKHITLEHAIGHLPSLESGEKSKIKNSEQENIISILGICEDINHYAKNKSHGDAYKFEDILTRGLNYFYDVVAEKHASAGTTDIECIFTNEEEVDEKFDVEAKSTKKKLLQINAGRLRHHREIVNSKYTIVITPNFAPAVLEDIKKSKNVVLRSSSFSNFLYQSISKNGREISYEPIHNIINNNLGVDITPHINQYVYENFGIESK